MCSVPGLAFLERGRQPTVSRTLGALACLLLANPAAFFLLVQPANAAILRTTPDALPPDWATLRTRWEYGHAIRFVLHLVGFCALLASTLAATPGKRTR
ncbi:MAG: DUF1772 domain-containing protein [Chloroflexota bacterium]|nr:DUF1772 domain-containing protein [Chloroflexota bacterium]